MINMIADMEQIILQLARIILYSLIYHQLMDMLEEIAKALRR